MIGRDDLAGFLELGYKTWRTGITALMLHGLGLRQIRMRNFLFFRKSDFLDSNGTIYPRKNAPSTGNI